MANTIYDIPVKTIDGTETTLADYKDKVLLLVNVASKCGLTPQYEGLQKLYADHQAQGFEVLGFPANNFGGQEPGTEEEIKDFCDTNFNVQFPLFSKISVKGEDQHPLYKYLTETKTEADVSNGDEFENKLKNYGVVRENANDITWNFEKFLIGKDGEIAARFAPDVTAEDERLVEKINAELGK
jgi:glutathione peroxidase